MEHTFAPRLAVPTQSCWVKHFLPNMFAIEYMLLVVVRGWETRIYSVIDLTQADLLQSGCCRYKYTKQNEWYTFVIIGLATAFTVPQSTRSSPSCPIQPIYPNKCFIYWIIATYIYIYLNLHICAPDEWPAQIPVVLLVDELLVSRKGSTRVCCITYLLVGCQIAIGTSLEMAIWSQDAIFM